MCRRPGMLAGLMLAALGATVAAKLRTSHAKVDWLLPQSASKAQGTVRRPLATVLYGTGKAHIAAEYFPITKDAFQLQYGGGNSDNFVTKIAIGTGDDHPPALHRGPLGSAHPSGPAVPHSRMNEVFRDSH